MAQKDDELEKQKLINEQLTTKKLQQETHWLKTWLLPIVQFLSAGLLVFVTYLIGSNTNLLKSQDVKNEIDKSVIENTSVLNTNKQVLQSIILERGNDSLKTVKISLENKKSALWLQINKLSSLTTSLRNNNENLKQTITRSERRNFQLQYSSTNLNSKLVKSQKNLDSTNAAIDFSEIKFSLNSIKNSPYTNNPSTLTLINTLQANSKFEDRIIDSLFHFKQLKIPYLYGLSDFILYFGTGDVMSKYDIENEVKTNFDFTINSKFNLSNLINNPNWPTKDKIEFRNIYLDLLQSKLGKQEKTFILNEIAQIQSSYPELNLAKENFDAYLFYIHSCKTLNENFYASEEDFNDDKKIVECLAIMCPQVFIANYLTTAKLSIPYNQQKIDSAQLRKINIVYLQGTTFFKRALMDKITGLLESINFASSLQGELLENSINKQSKIINYWLDVYNGNVINKDDVRSKILNGKM